MSRPTGLERARQTARLLRTEGAAGVAARLLSRGAEALRPAGWGGLPVGRERLARAAEILARGEPLPDPAPWRPGEPLDVAWVCAPAGEGSGGHTTMFRIAAELEHAGHRCTVYVDDRHGWEIEQHRRTIRAWWPWLGAEVRDLAAGLEDAHVVLATSWETAYPVLASPARGARAYFVQDFEPAFHPGGSVALLAEATYRFGFHGVAAGPWLAQRLRREYGMPAGHFEFGVDHERYSLGAAGRGEREGVCYFCRPSTPRRAHELAVAALDAFAARHPEALIHLYGEPAPNLPFAALDHGLLPPERLAELYRRCAAGLVLSATNVSLVPHEMLACGCVPVVNDAPHNRIVLDNENVAYAGPTPDQLAAALSRLLAMPNLERQAAAEAAATSVSSLSWERSGRQAEAILLDLVGAAHAAHAAEAVA